MTEDDDKLFRRLMAEAKPLKTSDRVASTANKPKSKARFSRADEKAVLEESLQADIDELETNSGEAMRFKRASVGRTTMRMLSRGSYAVLAEIDLHGMTLDEAKPRLEAFVRRCATNNKLCIRIVHGKGLGSGERGPVLKQAVNRWLRRWDVVLAFTSARQVDGGTGAVYVLLQAPK
ncbi:MAG: Smr/MutS family protein [Proteobacteria bacterium]|nr:Smr/MutS family protein [Pseudomonadota bacterium]